MKGKPTLKLKTIFFVVAVLASFGLAKHSWAGSCNGTTCTGSSPWTAVSPQWADVNHCVSVCAQPGDTVNIPPGTATWTQAFHAPDARCADSAGNHWNQVGGLCINKGINLIGAGIGKTIITSNLTGAAAMIVYNPSFASDEAFRISGFSFDLNATTSLIFLGAWGKQGPYQVQTKIRIDHNHVYSSSPPSVNLHFIMEMPGMYGVVDNNLIENLCMPFSSDSGIMTPSLWNSWNSSEYPGWEYIPGDKYVLMHEDNTINFGDCSDRTDVSIVSDGAYSCRYAYRYNTLNMKRDGIPVFDQHGNYWWGDPNNKSNMYSCFGMEIYGNDEIRNGIGTSYIDARDGRDMIFYNNNLGPYRYWNECNGDQNTWPVTYPPGQDSRDSYAFNNRSGPTGTEYGASYNPYCSPVCVGHCDAPQENVNFWKYNLGAGFDGTSGIGCGTYSTMAAITNCIQGVGFWVPNDGVGSCADITGYVGAGHTKNINGVLYRCDANRQWVSYYTPYQYPHSLRTDCINYPTLCDQNSDTTPPAAPSGLTVN